MTEGKARGKKTPFVRSAVGVANRKVCPGATELKPQGQDLGVRVQPGSRLSSVLVGSEGKGEIFAPGSFCSSTTGAKGFWDAESSPCPAAPPT